MLSWAVVFLIVAIIAAVFGFFGIAVAAAGIAKILFFIVIIFTVVIQYIIFYFLFFGLHQHFSVQNFCVKMVSYENSQKEKKAFESLIHQFTLDYMEKFPHESISRNEIIHESEKCWKVIFEK